jgi:hypothetical protein
MRKVSRLTAHILVATLLVASPLLWYKSASANPLSTRSVTVGSSAPGTVTTHRYNFNIDTVNTVGSIEFEYCTNSPEIGSSCNAPPGLNVSAANISAQTGETGFAIDPSTTANRLVISRAAGLTSAIPVSYTFSNVTNHSAPFYTVFVRVATFSSTDGTGSRVDSGAVAFATTSAISVSGFVPPYLTFCVGVVVALNCVNASGTSLDFGELSKTQPRFLTSQFSVATNDPGGYSTTLAGTTMTSGNNIIPGLAPPQTSQPGTSQFGMNLRANSNPAVGANPTGVGTGAISPNYNIPNQYFFNNQVIASSPIPSDFNLFTVSYVVNVSDAQSPGVYSTTLTYIASAAF